MSLRLGRVVSLMSGCAVLVAVACSSSSDDKQVGTPADGGAAPEGEGGETSNPVVGSDGGENTGGMTAAGAGAPGEAGTGGSPVGTTGGSGGGSGGSGACTPAGASTNITLTNDAQNACRGALLRNDIRAQGPDASFTCCGVVMKPSMYSVTVKGVSNDGSGDHLTLVVPAAAPIGAQSVTLTCTGDVSNTFDFEVVEGTAPVVTSADASITTAGLMHVTGQHLKGVTHITSASADPDTSPLNCVPSAPATDTAITCQFTGILPGNYHLLIEQDDCGFAVNAPEFTVTLAQGTQPNL